MKKVKIMLLSLALFAVVGGALAFKAKFNKRFCVTNAYFDSPGGVVRYYCSFDQGGGNFTTTTCGGISINNITTDPAGVQKLCTTTTLPGNNCDKVCDQLTSTKTD